MPGEFEPHLCCWMGWPTSGYLWREGAKPAQEQYAGVAKAISQFEPVKMIASPGEVRCQDKAGVCWAGRSQQCVGGCCGWAGFVVPGPAVKLGVAPSNGSTRRCPWQDF